MIKTRYSQVVFVERLRSEANLANSSMNSSDRSQLRNTKDFSSGEDVGFESKLERMSGASASHSIESVSDRKSVV